MEEKIKLAERTPFKLLPTRTIHQQLETCQVDLHRILKMNTPQRLTKIDLKSLHSQFLEKNAIFTELLDYLKAWNSRVDKYRTTKQFFKSQNALNTLFVELGLHLREICQTFYPDIQLAYLKNTKKWFEEVYMIFSEEFQLNHKKKQPLENPQDILDRIELAIASKSNNNTKIFEILARKKLRDDNSSNAITNNNIDQFKKFLPRPQTDYRNKSQTQQNFNGNKSTYNTQVEPISRKDSQLGQSSPKEGVSVVSSQVNIPISPATINNQKVQLQDTLRKCQTCQPGNRIHQYGHIPQQQQVKFISKQLDDKTRFQLEILKQKLNKDQSKKEHQQLNNFMQRWGKDRRQLMQLKNTSNEITFQGNDFGKLKYQKQEIEEELKRLNQSEQNQKQVNQDVFFPFPPQINKNNTNNDNISSFLSPGKQLGSNQGQSQYQSTVAEFSFQGKHSVMQSNDNRSSISQQHVKQLSPFPKKQDFDDSQLEEKINKNLFNNDSEDEEKPRDEDSPNRHKSKSRDITEEFASQIYTYSCINKQTVQDKIKIGDIYKKIESFESYNPQSYMQEDKISFQLPQTDRFDLNNNNDNEDYLSLEFMKQQALSSTPLMQKNKSQNYDNNYQTGSMQNSAHFKTTSTFFPNNNLSNTLYGNQIPTMETMNAIHSRNSSSQKNRTAQMSETVFNFQYQKQKSQIEQESAKNVKSGVYKQPVSVNLFAEQDQKKSLLYDKKLGQNYLDTQNKIVQEMKRNKINKLIQTKGKIVNLSSKEFPVIANNNQKGSDNELTEEIIKERLANSIMQYSTKVKEYQQSRVLINTKNKKAISDQQVIHDQIDEINKVRSVLSRKNISINAINLKQSLLTPILPIQDINITKNKSFLPNQGAHLMSLED